jgi:hypothetical protein
VVRPWWVKFAGAVRPSTVVVANVLREHHTQVPLTEDQHAVGEFGSEVDPNQNTIECRVRMLLTQPVPIGNAAGTRLYPGHPLSWLLISSRRRCQGWP